MRRNPFSLSDCIKYLEKHGGTLSMSMCKTKWPDGTETDFSWQYSAGDLKVCGAKTAIGAIRSHMERQ